MKLEDLTQEQIEDSRDEAKHREPNFDFDNLLTKLFDEYKKCNDDSLIRTEIEDNVNRQFRYMLGLDYSQVCITTYQRYWISIRDEYNGR